MKDSLSAQGGLEKLLEAVTQGGDSDGDEFADSDPDDLDEYPSLKSLLVALVNTTHPLLPTAFFSQVPTSSHWSSLLWYVARNCHEALLPHPLLPTVLNPPSALPSSALLSLARAEAPNETAELSEPQLVATLQDKPEGLLKEAKLLAFYPPSVNAAAQHSCCCSSSGGSSSSSSLVGDSCFSYLSVEDSSLDYRSRTEALRRRGRTCGCVRCSAELSFEARKGRPPSTGSQAPSAPTLLMLLALAKGQERYSDAVDLCEALVGQDPRNPIHLFEQARLEGYCDKFSRREALLLEAGGMGLAGGGEIDEAVAELRAYFRVVVPSPPDAASVTTPVYMEIEEFAEDNKALLAEEGEDAYEFSGSDDDDCGDFCGSDDGDDESEYGQCPKNHVFVAGAVLNAGDCSRMVTLAEEHLQGSWDTKRHYAVPTTDSPVYKIPGLLAWYNAQLEKTIFPLLIKQFGIDSGKKRLRVFDSFLVKYSAEGGQRRLPLHNDQSNYSLAIALNPSTDYEGGGTFFLRTGRVEKTEVGGIVSFNGGIEHAGESITKGTRYIIAAFIYEEEFGCGA